MLPQQSVTPVTDISARVITRSNGTQLTRTSNFGAVRVAHLGALFGMAQPMKTLLLGNETLPPNKLGSILRIIAAPVMTCKRCGSNHVKDFDGEVAIRIPEWKGADKATVMLFPELIVCVRCGVVEFVLPADKLEQIKSASQSSDSRS